MPSSEHQYTALEISQHRVIPQVPEYVGGEGFERAGVWSCGTIALGPLDGAGSINQALLALGVRPASGIEEFELVGLGRHRSLDEWLQGAG